MTSRARSASAPRRGANVRRRKAVTGVALLVALLAGLVGFAPSASAHHANIAATTECGYKVNWTASSWSNKNGEGDNSKIVVEYRLNGTGSFQEVPSGSPGSFQVPSSPAFDPFSGSFTAPGTPTSVDVRVRVAASWGNGTGGGQTQTVTRSFPTNCTPPASPSATARVDCRNDEIDISLTGKNQATTVDIYKNGTKIKDDLAVPVGPSTYSVPLAAGDENTEVTIKLDYKVGTDQTLKVNVDCDAPAQPGATIGWECGQDAAVQLKNTGGEAVKATIYKDDTVVEANITVGAGATVNKTVSMAGSEDDTVEIKVTFDDPGTGTDVQRTFEVDCDKPIPAAATPVCAQGGMLIALTNTGTDDAIFTVTSPALPGGSATVVVAPDQAGQSVLIPLAEDATTSVTVTAEGKDLYSNQSLKRDCQKPTATVEFDCAVGGVLVSLTNPGTEAALVDVNGEQVNVPAGTSTPVTRTIAVAEGAAYDVTVLGQSAKGIRDCEKPAATLSFDCAEGGVVVALSNTGDLPTTVEVNGVDVVVAAHGTVEVKVPVAEGATYNVVVTGDDGLNKTATGTRDCEKPLATVTFSCAAGGVVVNLTNGGELPTTVDVRGEQVVVPAGTTFENPVTRTIVVAEGEAYDVTVLGQSAKGTRDCEKPAATQPVLDCAEGGVVVTLSNPGELPTIVKVNGVDHTIPANGSQKVTIPVAEGAGYSVTVTGDDGLNLTATGTRDCEKPAVRSITLECAQGGVVVVLGNSGELEATATVNGQTVKIPANGSTSVTVPVEENADYDFDVVVDGATTNVEGTRDCEQPTVVSAILDCAQGGVVVVLTNAGASSTTVTVAGSPVEVGPGATVSTVVPVEENASYSIAVTGDELDETFTGTRDCEQPRIDSAEIDCAEGGVVVVLSNPGASDTTVTVDGEPVVVPAGQTVEVLVPVEENEAYDITVEGDEILEHITGTRDCLHPQPVVDEDIACAAGGVTITLRNTGDDTATFTVTSEALADGSVEVALEPGEVRTVLIPLAEDASTEVTVTSGEDVLFDESVTRSCEEVEPTTITRPPAEVKPAAQVKGVTVLPRTGSDGDGLLAAGGALLLAGAAMLIEAARRRRSLLA